MGSPSVPRLPPERARRQLLSPFDFPAGLTDDSARRAGEIVVGFLSDVLDLAEVGATLDAPMDETGEAAAVHALGAVAVVAAHCIGWTAPPEIAALRMVAGGLYRNSLGAELHAIEQMRGEPIGANSNPFRQRIQVFGEIWVVESRDDLFGTQRHLATAAGLADCGYQLIEGDPA